MQRDRQSEHRKAHNNGEILFTEGEQDENTERETKRRRGRHREGEKASRDSVGSEVATAKFSLVQDESRLSAK